MKMQLIPDNKIQLSLPFVSTIHTLLHIYVYVLLYNRKPREEETKAEPILYPNSNPMIACELLVPVLKYKTRGTTGCLFLSEYNSGVLIYWSPVPKVQDPQ